MTSSANFRTYVFRVTTAQARPAPSHEEALAIRNRLLAWRLTQRAEIQLRPERALEGVEPRINQSVLALLSLIEDPRSRQLIGAFLSAEQGRIYGERRASFEGLM